MNLLDQIVAARRLSIARSRADRARSAADRADPDATSSVVSPSTGGLGATAGAPSGVETAATSGHGFTIDAMSGLDNARSAPPVRPFRAALSTPGRRIIAEIKRRSPSAGIIRPSLDPVAIARMYETAGAAALSVLTEPEFFGGADVDLVEARAATALPVLRKDFILDREQLLESRALGADAVLLLASVLSQEELTRFIAIAADVGLDALVEAHDEAEIDAALAAGASIIGVNSRDLRDFSVDLRRAERLARRIPAGIVRVAESGIHTRDDVSRLEGSGYTVFLVGESLLRAPDPAARLRELFA